MGKIRGERLFERATLVGRAADISNVSAQLEQRLVTLTGMGGVGKTSLAMAVLGIVSERFDDVWFCELASVFEADSIDEAVADSIGAFWNHDASAVEAVTSALQGRHALLVLDNVEQIVGGAGRFVARLLAACPDLRVLVTSREALRLDGEVVLRVAPLPIDDEALTLFAWRAAAVSPSFSLAEHASAVRDICGAVDGLPLAIELAAARLATLSVNDVRDRLDQRFGLLRGDDRNERHATLAATVQWSYDLLGPDERQLFDRLSVFHGGFDLTGAGAVLESARRGRIEEFDVVRLVDSLTAKSMLTRVEGIGGPRWEILETLRHFGDRQLAERGERSSVRNAHLDHMLSVASLAGAICHSDQWSEGVARFRLEWDNLRSAVDWAIGTQRLRDVDRLLRDMFLMSRWSLETEPSTWALRATERGSVTDTAAGAPAFLHVAFRHFLSGDHERALEANLAALDATGTPSDWSWARQYAAIELLYLGRTAEAAAMADRMLAEPPPRAVERAMQMSAHAVFKLFAGQMDVDTAITAISRSHDVAASTLNPVALGHVSYNLGLAAITGERADDAGAAFGEAMRLGREHGIPNLVGYVLTARVYTPGRDGLAVAADALDYWRTHRDVGNEFVVLEATGINLVELGRLEDAGMVLGNLDQDPRRIASSVDRRNAAMAKILRSRKGKAALLRGATMSRNELLDHARAAVATVLAQ
jgi:predicted ATPase